MQEDSHNLSWWSLANLACAQAARLDAEALDRQLLRRERCALAVHLLLCPWCRRYHAQIRAMRRWVEVYYASGELDGDALPAAARGRIAQTLRSGDEPRR